VAALGARARAPAERGEAFGDLVAPPAAAVRRVSATRALAKRLRLARAHRSVAEPVEGAPPPP